MKRGTTGALLLLILGVTAVLVFARLQPWMVARSAAHAAEAERFAEARQEAAERVASTLRIAGDGSLGHWFLRSPEMRKRAGLEGLTVRYVEDGGSTAERLQRLAAGVYEAVALPVVDYLELGSELYFPGVIVAALAQSRAAGEKARGELVEVLVVRREVARERPETVRAVLALYFQVLEQYAHNPTLLVAELSRATGLEPEPARTELARLDYFDLAENRRLQLADVLIAGSDSLVRSGRLDGDPLGGNPYSITDGAPVAALADQPIEITFEPLTAEGWSMLEPVAGEPPVVIPFARWEAEPNASARARLDRLASWLEEHPRCRLRIAGHTASGGDEEQNRALSRARAEAVRHYLEGTRQVSSARLLSEGLGSAQPPPPAAGESSRAYRDRLSRVEIIALEARPL